MELGFENAGIDPQWGFESKLADLLRPVTPDPVFVETLKLKLSQTPVIMLESGKKHAAIFAVGAGLLAGTIAFWIYKRIRN